MGSDATNPASGEAVAIPSRWWPRFRTRSLCLLSGGGTQAIRGRLLFLTDKRELRSRRWKEKAGEEVVRVRVRVMVSVKHRVV